MNESIEGRHGHGKAGELVGERAVHGVAARTGDDLTAYQGDHTHLPSTGTPGRLYVDTSTKNLLKLIGILFGIPLYAKAEPRRKVRSILEPAARLKETTDRA